jgi:hypothetical protein
MSPARPPAAEGTGSFCLNCDNRHGCKGGLPPCQCLEREESEAGLRGKALMARRGLLRHCPACPLFRQCWTEEAYRRALAGRG